ncbi:MAG TPA: DNA repair protein RecN [Candidatus Cybelea sp.]|jgi:DNA repair protein RecN (Recombination protein N)|nr:DNA repair protein RecN [Candidatus Cybelea sp.]
MLRQLLIEGYGLIERADVEFAGGATIFTGETGSGKTMLIGALDFALGGRAGGDVVRRGARRALVTLVFDPDDALRERLRADGFELDPGEAATIAREMTDAGRSTLRVNGRASTAAYVREMRDAIAEIVGQHEAQRLLAASYHLELLDRFAGERALALRAEVANAYARAEAATAALARLTGDERRERERYEDAAFAAQEIESARLESGEPERLVERRGYLDNVERIATALHAASESLAAEERGVTSALGAAAGALANVERFDPSLREMAQRASSLQSESVELAADVARALDGAEYEPAELDAINTRLELIDRLKRKYGATFEEIAAAASAARRTVDEYEGRDRRAATLEAEVATADRELHAAAASLTSVRSRAATALRKRIVAEFAEIALGSGRFDVALEPLERIGAQGAERAEFLFAANAGEPARPLLRVASGGELSRVLLALVVVLAEARDARSALVFDEIDTGIGGATATAVGGRIGALARHGEVVCVTHLAQLATWADRHYVLDKIEAKKETTIVVRPIETRKDREAEIARMLSGESHDAALRHARALLASAAKVSGGS